MSEAMAERPAPATLERLVLFDGLCGFCDRAVRWMLAHDREGRLHYAPLQGATAARLRERHAEIPVDTETLVYVDASSGEECVYLRSEAIFRLCAELDRGWRWLSWLRWLPRGLTDLVYGAFVRRRYRLFGRLDACRVPAPHERARFLD